MWFGNGEDLAGDVRSSIVGGESSHLSCSEQRVGSPSGHSDLLFCGDLGAQASVHCAGLTDPVACSLPGRLFPH